jgi:peptidoglycan/LPS O-acetylase OafA/YrhL
MVAGFAVRVTGSVAGTPLLAAGGTLAALGAYIFAYVLWRTMDGPAKKLSQRSQTREHHARLPLAEAVVPAGGSQPHRND